MLECETYAFHSDTSTFYNRMSAQSDERVDPRIERSRMVILEAAVQELAGVGYGGVTIESVAARAGVGKSTIYRHWPDKLALIADAFETFHVQMVPDLGDRSARESVELLISHVAEVVIDSTFSRCIPALIEGAERDPRVREFHHRYSAERRQALVDVIARGVEDGELDPGLDAELATAALLGVLFYRRLMTGEPFDPADAGVLVDLVLGPRREPSGEPPRVSVAGA
jgi:TetR/AcrR family transcriptional regulator of autoinduction and epiphytic fitness